MERLIDRTLDSYFQLERDRRETLEMTLLAGMDEALQQISNPYITLPPEFIRSVSSVLVGTWTTAITESAGLTRDELSRKADSNLFDRFVVEYITRYGRQKANQIISTTATQMTQRVRREMSQGKSFLTAVKDLTNDLPEIARMRTRVILATEVHAAGQFASQRAAETSGVSLKKIWNCILDERTRRFGWFGKQDAFNHLVMNQTQVALQHSFSVPRRMGGFERLHFPGDPQGSAGNIINCRCVQTYERA